MSATVPTDIAALVDALLAAQRDSEMLVAGLTESQGMWRPTPSAWSVASCLEHLALTNRLYLDAMAGPARNAEAAGRTRRGPATPGFFGGMFVQSLEPPPKWYSRLPAPPSIRPAASPTLNEAVSHFTASHTDVVTFLRENSDLDLAGTMFANPFVRGLSFSLATGLHAIAAHERRHLRQAWIVRRSMSAGS